LRVPLIVRWPGKISPAVADEPLVNTDVTPTLLGLTGSKVPAGLDGMDLSPDWLGTREDAESPAPRTFCWHFPHYTNQGSRPAGAVRFKNWKLIEYYEDGKHELYDLASDISEEHDVAQDHPERVKELAAKLAAWRKEVGAQENKPNPDFNSELHRRIYVEFDTTRVKLAKTAAEMAETQRDWRKRMDEAVRKK
jgi:arylsulfatase A-like enzyme